MESIKSYIIKYIESEGPKFGGQIEDYIRGLVGAKASNASRRCRELCTEGILEREAVQIDGKGPHVVRYRITQVRIPIIGTINSKTEKISTFKGLQGSLKLV
jgi:hypothetical protein